MKVLAELYHRFSQKLDGIDKHLADRGDGEGTGQHFGSYHAGGCGADNC